MRKIFLFVFSFFFIQTGLASSIQQDFLSSNLTVGELNNYVNELKNENSLLQEKSKEYGELISFIKTDLSKKEITEIKETIDLFIEKRTYLLKEISQKTKQLQDIEKEKKELILLRADVYKYIAQYVEKTKRDDFLEHIKFQVQSEKESKDLIEQIKKSEIILDQKVNFYKEKIAEHKRDLDQRIDEAITQKIKQRIDEIDQNPKYKFIPQANKNAIYKDFIKQLKQKISENKSQNFTQNYKELRESILLKMISEIQSKIK